MRFLLDHPGILVAGIAVLPAFPAFPFRWVLALLVASFLWAGTTLPGWQFVQDARWGLLALALAHGALRLRGAGPGERPPLPVTLLTLWIALSFLWAERVSYSGPMFAAFLAVGTLVFALVPRLAPTVGHGVRAAHLLVGTAAAVLLLGFVPGLAQEAATAGSRLRGGFSNANGLGFTCAILAPWLFVLGLDRRGFARVAAWTVVLALGVLAFLSGSRTGFGGYLVALSAAAFLRYPSRFLLLLGLAGIAVSLLALAAGGDVDVEESGAAHLVRPQTIESLSGRLAHWEHAVPLVLARPLHGHGYVWSWDSEGRNFHSMHVETLVDLGLVGEVLLLCLLVTLGRRMLRLAKEAVDPAARSAGAAMAGAFGAVALDSFFHSWFLRPGGPHALLFWCLAGLALRMERLAVPARVPAAHAARGIAPVPA